MGQAVDVQQAAVGVSGTFSHRHPFLFGQEDTALYRHLGTQPRDRGLEISAPPMTFGEGEGVGG